MLQIKRLNRERERDKMKFVLIILLLSIILRTLYAIVNKEIKMNKYLMLIMYIIGIMLYLLSISVMVVGLINIKYLLYGFLLAVPSTIIMSIPLGFTDKEL